MGATVSIVTAVYKAEPYLRQCIDSILGQSYQDWKLVLVDDGSPDNCPAICDAYAEKDPRIKVIHQPNQGAIHARNAGIRAATGEYIMFVDSDDWIDTQLVEKVMSLAPFSLALFGCTQTSADGQILNVSSPVQTPRRIRIAEEPALMEALCHNSLFGYACNKIYHRDIIGDTLFEPWRDREDLTFNLKVFRSLTHLVLSSETGYFYRQHSGSSLHIVYNCPVPNYIETTKTILERFMDLSLENRELLANRAAKTYLLDAIFRYIKNNASLSQKEKKQEIARAFSDDRIRSGLSLRYNTCKLQFLLSLCCKLRLPSVYYHIGVR